MKKTKSVILYIAFSTILCGWTAFVFGGGFLTMPKDKICGIYKIKNPENKIYIGRSIDIYSRWYMYETLNCQEQPKIYESILKYGVKSHEFSIITICDRKELRELEIKYIKIYDCYDVNKGLNLKNCFELKGGRNNKNDNIRSGNIISIRIDDETQEIWSYLKSQRVNVANVFRIAGKEEIDKLAVRYRMKKKENKCPF